MGKLGYYLKSIHKLLFGFERPFQILRIFLGGSPPGRQLVTLRHPPVSMHVRGRMDVWSIKEAFIDRFYTKYGCECGDDWTVIDIGAAIGEFCILVAVTHPKTRIIAYEPFLDSVGILKDNLLINGITNVEVHPYAVWHEAATLSLDLSQQEPLMISSAASAADDQRLHPVRAVSLSEVLSMNKLKSVDLLKMDCEGAEFDILLGSDSKTITAFKRIVMEYHDGVDDRNHIRLAAALEQLGYRVSYRQNAVHPDIGYLYAEQA